MSQAEAIAATPEDNNNTPEDNNNTPEDNNNTPEVKIVNAGTVLASGFDTVVLALSITWKTDEFFRKLDELKANAIAQGAEMPGVMESEKDLWVFNIRPHGSEGYAFLFGGADYHIKLIRSTFAGSRPSAMVEIRSATLWRMGHVGAIERILHLLEAQGARIDKARASRVDPCLDILLPESIWIPDVAKYAVKRASHEGLYQDDSVFCGFAIGKGDLQARLYDKPHEIKTKSKKDWMYDVWGVKEVPAGGRIVRVEFQLRREALLELGIDTIRDLVNHPRSLWAYCTEKWLKFQDRPEVHHTQQKTLCWWKTVQDGFLGGQRACPLIRAKTVAANKIQLSQQLFGQLSSLLALQSDGDITPGGEIQIEEPLSQVMESAELIGMDPSKFYEKVRRKIAKYVHDVEKFKNAQQLRKELGLPVIRTCQGEKGGAE